MSETYTPSIIERLQLDMGAIATAHPYFSNVPVNIVRPRYNADGTVTTAVMIQDAINNALTGIVGINGASGATIIIDMPEGEVPFPETPGPDLRLICKVRVIENPLFNMGATGTLKSAEDLMLAVLNLFHLRYWQDAGATMIADKDAFRPRMDEVYLAKSYVAYETRFLMRMGIGGPVKTPMPGISGDSQTGVILVGVANSTIYYTTDGSYPTPTNGSQWNPPLLAQDGNPLLAQSGEELLTTSAPIPVAAGTLVRAVAYQACQLASDLAAKTIS